MLAPTRTKKRCQTPTQLENGAFMAITPGQNNPVLYRWVYGYFLRKLRGRTDLNQTQVGKAVGLTQGGYFKIEQGKSPNMDPIYNAFEFFGKDIASMTVLSRIIVKAIQAEEATRDEDMSSEEREALANELIATLNPDF